MSTPFPAPEREGNLVRIFFPRLLCRLHRLSFLGTLQVRNGSLTKSVYFRDGQILSAASNDEADRLSSLLLRDGLLSREQLEMAREKAPPGTSLGRSLVDLGFVSRHQLMETARNQVRAILADLFAWEAGEYQVQEKEIPAAVPNLGLRTEQLLLETLRNSTRREAILREIGGMDRRFRPVQDAGWEWRRWSLGPEAERVLRAVNGVRSVSQIASEAGLDDFTAAKILCAGTELGVLDAVDLSPPAAPDPPPAAPAPASEETEAAAEILRIPVRAEASAPVATVELAAPPDPRPPAPVPGRRPARVREEIPPDEGPFHGFVDTSAEAATRRRGAGGGGGSSGRRWVASAGVLVASALILFGLFLWLRREPPVGEGAPTLEPISGLDAPTGEQEQAPTEGPGGEVQPGAPIPEAAPGPRDGESPEPPRVEPPPPPTAPAGGPPAGADPRQALAAGWFELAAQGYRDALAADPKGYTLQILLACRESTVAALLPPPEEMFLLPQKFRGRDCYRVCWGRFPDRGAALRGAAELPRRLSGLNGPPLPVAISGALGEPGHGPSR
ncbi:MAG: DUF4388 domain-containing protein [Acidobacteria bacterium]|nr:DUF4388 domain-containing protein [Acidobacteriota bacterium]